MSGVRGDTNDPEHTRIPDGAPVPGDDTLPWWRRPRHLRRQLTATLALVALASILLVAGLNFVAARQLLDDGTKDQLVGIGEARARSIELGIDQVLDTTSGLAADLSVVDALVELSQAYRDIAEAGLSNAEQTELEAYYVASVVEPLSELPLEPAVTLGDVLPRTDAGRYLQYHYTITAPPEERRNVVDARDGSEYSALHERFHPYLRGLANTLGLGDLMLLDAEGDVVYTVEKRVDFGTNFEDGPYRDTQLADTVLRRLPRLQLGEAALTDIDLYLPGGAEPVAFAATTVRDGTEVVGTLVTQIPVSALNAITTAGGRWEEVGLSSGESYVVGPDRVLVSESRLWIEDPDAYLGRLDDPTLTELVTALGSPVGLQPVDTKPVDTALDGGVFEGTSKNYLDQRMFTYATPISVRGVDWVVVADIPLSEARGPLYDYAKTVGLVTLVILPLAALVGLWLARRLTRPIPPVVEAALAVAGGERNPDIPDLGRDEFGDLARRLGQMTTELERQESALTEELDERRRLLLSVLPSRLVSDPELAAARMEVTEIATVIAASVTVGGDEVVLDDREVAALLAEAVRGAEDLAEAHGIEPVRTAADLYLFVAGIGAAGAEDDAGLAFAVDLRHMLGEMAHEEELPLDVHLGVASGTVVTGMIKTGGLTCAAWGEPVHRALALSTLADADSILVDDSTAASVTREDWTLEPVALDDDGSGQTYALAESHNSESAGT